MIKSIQLNNFQCHKNLSLSFDAGITAITGDSDRGKSAVIRAFQWVAFNRPAADTLMTYGTKEMSVTITTDAHTVTRFKTASKNGYDLDGKEYLAIGRDVPSDVQAALGLTEISFQSQFDSPFMLSDSSGEVGRQLNELVDLTIIDRTTSNINRRVKDTNKTIKILEKQEEQQKEELAQYKDLAKAAKALDALKTEYGVFVGKNKQADSLENILKKAYPHGLIVKSLHQAGDAIASLNHIADASKKAVQLQQQSKDLSTTLARHDTYNKTIQNGVALSSAMQLRNVMAERAHNASVLFDEYNDLASSITALRRATKAAGKGKGALGALRAVEILLNKQSELVGARSSIRSLEMLLNRVRSAQDHAILVAEDVTVTESEHKDLFGDACPLCGAATGSLSVG